MIRLTLLCNASTGAARRAAFPVDEPIDEFGQADAAARAGEFRNHDRVVASPALRARQTAEALGLTAEIEPALRDLDYGRWAGRTSEEVAALDARGVSDWQKDPASVPHGGESLTDLFARVETFLERSSRERGSLLAVTHAAVIRAAIVLALGAPIASFWRIDIAPFGQARLNGDGTLWRLRLIGK